MAATPSLRARNRNLCHPTMKPSFLPIRLVVAGLVMGCFATVMSAPSKSVTSEPWGHTKDGRSVELFTLRNAAGMEVKIASYGCTIVSLTAPDRAGVFADVVLGKDSLAAYEAGHPFFGCIAGRFANRINHGKFTLDGKEHQLGLKSGAPHHLHGGVSGFDKKVWAGTKVEGPHGVGVKLHYVSPDGEEGYPGTLDTTVTCMLTDGNELQLTYEATTDKPTVVNLTNHSYFNLAGEGSGTALDHELTIFAGSFTATDADLIPTGKIESVAGTPLDFLQPHKIGERIGADFGPLKQGLGYDHNFVLGLGNHLVTRAALVHEPKSGRTMEVLTDQPGVQLYTANHLVSETGKHGHIYHKRDALCLETQHFPDSPNHPSFPSVTLRPGEVFSSQTLFRFSAQ